MQGSNTKDALRETARRARAAIPAERWAADDAARTAALLRWLPRSPGTLACYAARPGEPGTQELIDTLTARGWRLLLPVLRRQPDWAVFTGWDDMRPGWAGIPEPTGRRLGASALAEAAVIVVPCLAVGRDGTRLGTGGGWYDRALPRRRPGATVAALARAPELVDSVPAEPHDIPVDWCLTETGTTALLA